LIKTFVLSFWSVAKNLRVGPTTELFDGLMQQNSFASMTALSLNTTSVQGLTRQMTTGFLSLGDQYKMFLTNTGETVLATSMDQIELVSLLNTLISEVSKNIEETQSKLDDVEHQIKNSSAPALLQKRDQLAGQLADMRDYRRELNDGVAIPGAQFYGAKYYTSPLTDNEAGSSKTAIEESSVASITKAYARPYRDVGLALTLGAQGSVSFSDISNVDARERQILLNPEAVNAAFASPKAALCAMLSRL